MTTPMNQLLEFFSAQRAASFTAFDVADPALKDYEDELNELWRTGYLYLNFCCILDIIEAETQKEIRTFYSDVRFGAGLFDQPIKDFDGFDPEIVYSKMIDDVKKAYPDPAYKYRRRHDTRWTMSSKMDQFLSPQIFLKWTPEGYTFKRVHIDNDNWPEMLRALNKYTPGE